MVARILKQTEESRKLGNFFMELELRGWFEEPDADWCRLGKYDDQGRMKFDDGT
jgi:hypothetical protein